MDWEVEVAIDESLTSVEVEDADSLALRVRLGDEKAFEEWVVALAASDDY